MIQYSKVFVYLRFSSDAQAEGDSFARQRGIAEAYLKQANIPNEKVEWVEDPAFSAYHGEHISSGALGKLLRKVREKLITDGLLIIESVDRASRQGGWRLISMLDEFLEAGFYIYFLDQRDNKPFNKDNQPEFYSTYISIRAELARLESERKSDLSTANWRKRRELARERKEPFSAECPLWLRVEGGKYIVEKEKAASIQAVFELARDGWGVTKIIRYANQQKWSVPGKGNKWHTSLLNRLFKNKALIGEFQPHIGTRSRKKPSGSPIQDYYPQVIDADLFYTVRGIRDKANEFPKRRDINNYNYLQGLGKCECGGTWRRLSKNSAKQRGYAQYSCSNRQLGETNCKNMNSRIFDAAFIGAACEKIPSLLTVVDSKREEKKAGLEGRLSDIKQRISKLIDLYEASGGSIPEVLERIEKAKTEQQQVSAALSELEKNVPPEGEFDFGDAVTAYLPAFLDIHEEDTEEAQTAYQARALFRAKIIQSVDAVVVNKDRTLMEVRLKNNAIFEQVIEERRFGFAIDVSEEEEAETKGNEKKALKKLLAA